MHEGVIERSDGRSVGWADYGDPGHTAVLWCHGGPGSRHEPAYVADRASEAGLRLVGIDRPGYGWSDPQPGRTIAGWVPDGIAVTDELGIDSFLTIGVSTGGAYSFALAATHPRRVSGVVACCAMTDMRHEAARATMSRPHALAVWEAPDRDAAIEAAVASHGIDGGRILESGEGPSLPASDLAMLTSPWAQRWIEDVPTMFAHGLEGYADDRIADGPGWVDFDIGDVVCPVLVLHGSGDVMCLPVHAEHTAELIPSAELRVIDGLGHFSIEDEVVPTLVDLAAKA